MNKRAVYLQAECSAAEFEGKMQFNEMQCGNKSFKKSHRPCACL